MWCSMKFLLWNMAEQCLFKVATSIFLFFRVPTSWFIIFVTVRATSSQISWSLVHTWISNVLLSQVPAINNVRLGAVQKVCISQYVLTLAAIFSETVTPTSMKLPCAHREHFCVLCDAAWNSYYEIWPNSAYSKLLPRFSCFSGSLLRDSLFS